MLRGPLLHAPVSNVLNGVDPVSRRIARDRKVRLTTKTIDQYTHYWSKLQERYPGVRVNEFTREHLDDYISQDANGKRRVIGAPGYSEAQVNSIVTAIRFAFKWSLRQGLIPVDPAASLREDWYRKPVPQRDNNWLEGDEVTDMVDRTVAGEDPFLLRDLVLVQFMVGTALRRFEVVDTTWDLLSAKGPGELEVSVPHGKGNKRRLVIATSRTAEAIAVWRQAVTGLSGGAPRPDWPVFPRVQNAIPVGGPKQFQWDRALGKQGIADVVHRAGLRIDVHDLRPHDLRRTHAGLLQDEEAPLDEIKEQLGHANLAVTEGYLKSRPDKRRARLRSATF